MDDIEVIQRVGRLKASGVARNPEVLWLCELAERYVAAFRRLQDRRSVGRPRVGRKSETFEATKPWKSEGMSRRTWYRRRKEMRDGS